MQQQSTTARITGLAALRRHRATSGERAERRRLIVEISAFQSPAEIAELEAILDRHSDADAAPVREVLAMRYAA